MLDDAAAEFAPHGVVLGRTLDGAFDGVGVGVLVVHGAGGEVFGHEAELDHGADAGGFVLVEDLVEDGEVVDGLAGGVEREDVGGGPLELGGAVAGGEEVMGADVDGRGREVVQLGQELAAILHGGEVGLVVAEPGADGIVRAEGLGEIDLDGDLCRRRWRRHGRFRRGGLRRGWDCGEAQHGDCELTHGRMTSWSFGNNAE